MTEITEITDESVAETKNNGRAEALPLFVFARSACRHNAKLFGG
jgi:hypothetical protein